MTEPTAIDIACEAAKKRLARSLSNSVGQHKRRQLKLFEETRKRVLPRTTIRIRLPERYVFFQEAS